MSSRCSRFFGLLLVLAALVFAIPSSRAQQDGAGKLAYAAEHFWDKYDWADTSKANMDLGEQGFSNFLFLLGRTDSLTMDRACAAFVRGAFSNRRSRDRFASLSEHYLWNPESPLRNDAVYVALLRHMAQAYGDGDSVGRDLCLFRLRMVWKNLPGSVATDFVYIDREGRSRRMSETESPYTLLVFYSPDCEHCEKILPQLLVSPALRNPRVRVLAVFPDADTEKWRMTRYEMPPNWTDGYSPEGEISAEALYYIPATPSFYLLDSDKRVLLKDPSPDRLLQVLEQLP